jgi:hypothetical protein
MTGEVAEDSFDIVMNTHHYVPQSRNYILTYLRTRYECYMLILSTYMRSKSTVYRIQVYPRKIKTEHKSTFSKKKLRNC